MTLPQMVRSFTRITLCTTLVCSAAAQAPSKPLITNKYDLPRFSYPVQGSVEQLLSLPAKDFVLLVQPAIADLTRMMHDYQVEDHATLALLLETKLNFAILSEDDAAAMKLIPQIRALQEKPGEKLVGDLVQEAFLRSRQSAGSTHATGESCPPGYQETYRAMAQSTPWTTVSASLEEQKRRAEIVTKPFFMGLAEARLGPVVNKEHALTLDEMNLLMEARSQLMVTIPCKQATLDVLTPYIASHRTEKKNIWLAREAVLPPADKLTPVKVGIWDSGFDTKLFPGQLFNNPDPTAGDPHGFAFDVLGHATHGELIPLTPQQAENYPTMVVQMQALGDIASGIDSPAVAQFKQKASTLPPQQMRSLLDELSIIEGYAHGTHVAGIAAHGNPAIRLAYVRMTYDNGNPHMAPTDPLVTDIANSEKASVQWFRDHGIRIVNMSFSDSPSIYERDLAANGIGHDDAERKKLARHYFDIERNAMFEAIKTAPEILFVTIAGNSNANNAFEEDIPSSFRLPNLIVTGAVDDAGDATDFTSYGDNVLVDADGKAVESLVPGGAKVKMSGTSMAAPQVTNLAAKLLAIAPKLTPAQLVALIRDGATTSDDGRHHLINPMRSVELLTHKSVRATESTHSK